MGLFSDFERIIEGGLQENTVYLMRGLPGSGKTAFCTTLLKELLEKGKDCVYLTTELSPRDFMAHTKHGFGVDFEPYVKKGKLLFLDACTWKIGKSGPGVINISDLTALGHELSMLLVDVCDKKKERFFLFFDSITSLIIYSPPEIVVKFLQALATRMRETCEGGIPGVFTVETGIHDDKIINMMSFFMDGIFETRVVPVDGDIARQFCVATLKSAKHETKWLPTKIDKNGFRFLMGELKKGVKKAAS